MYIDVFLQTYRNFYTPSSLLERLKNRLTLTSLRVAKEQEITHMTKEQLKNRTQEFIDLNEDSIKLVKLRYDYHFSFFLSFSNLN